MEAKEREKPVKLADKHLTFLDELRESGATNMFGARPYLQRRFRTLTENEARDILLYWMDTFSGRHPR